MENEILQKEGITMPELVVKRLLEKRENIRLQIIELQKSNLNAAISEAYLRGYMSAINDLLLDITLNMRGSVLQ
jgi:hypothetical protein